MAYSDKVVDHYNNRRYHEAISNLTPGTRYHYQVVATNSMGASFGQDLAFDTLVLPLIQFTGRLTGTPGAMQLSLASATGASFTVLSSTNLLLPVSNWTAIGTMTEVSSGQYQFTDPGSSTNRQVYYRLRSP